MLLNPPTFLAVALCSTAALAQPVAPTAPVPQPQPALAPAAADPRIDWLKNNATAIRTIDPADENFADLQGLKQAIGKSRVVMLGEQSHGDGSTFKAKSRLVKFLHKEMGFDILAWESGLFDCREVDAGMKRGDDADKAWDNGIFGIWSLSKEALPALRYVSATQKTDRPITTVGFDSQFTSASAKDRFAPFIETFFDKADAKLLTETHRKAIKDAIAWIKARDDKPSADEPVEAMTQIKAILAVMDEKKETLLKAHDATEVGFTKRILANLLAFIKQQSRAGDKSSESVNIRDRAMGESLLYLAREKYPDRKIIVWAATFHLLRNPETIKSDTAERTTTYPMGDWVCSALEDEAYTVMFTAGEGRAGIAWMQDWDIGAPKDGSLEDLCVKSGRDLLFIDLRAARKAGPDAPSAWLTKPMLARPMGYAYETTDWSNCFDGVFFTKTMVRSTHSRWK
jgi:erythromycin esterase